MNQKKRNDLFLLIFIFAAFLLLYLIGLRNGHSWGDDFSQYVAQARSIVDGNIDRLLEISRYRFHNSDIKNLGPVLYPWGYPLLLSGVYDFFGLGLLPMKLFTSLFFLLSLPVLFYMFRNRVERSQAFLIILILGLSPSFFLFKDNVTSDFPFMFFCLLSIFFMQRFTIEKRLFHSEMISNILIGASIFASCFIRSNGIVLLPTLFLIQCIENAHAIRDSSIFTRRDLKHATPYVIFLALTLIAGRLLPSESSSSYIDQLSLINVNTIMNNVVYYMKLPGVFFTEAMSPTFIFLGRVLYLASFPFVCFGVLKEFRGNYHFIIFSAFLLIIYVIWPGVQGIRFLFPILPFYLFFFIAGLSEIKISFQIPILSRYIKINFMLIFSIAIILVFGLTTISSAIYNMKHRDEVMEGPYSKDSIELIGYIIKYTNNNNIIIFYKPRAITLYTSRRSIALSNLSRIMASKAEYIACKKNDEVDMLLNKNNSIANQIFENAKFKLYRKNGSRMQ